MGKYPKHRKPSGSTVCIICGKTFSARGIGAHIRQAHGMVIKTIYNYVDVINNTTNDNTNVFTPTSEVEELRTEVEKKLSIIKTSKNLTESKNPEGSYLFIEQDVWILLSKLCQAAFNEDPENLLSVFSTNDIVSELIKDFEHRFNCKLEDAKKAYPNVRPSSTTDENKNLVNRYASLQYSR